MGLFAGKAAGGSRRIKHDNSEYSDVFQKGKLEDSKDSRHDNLGNRDDYQLDNSADDNANQNFKQDKSEDKTDRPIKQDKSEDNTDIKQDKSEDSTDIKQDKSDDSKNFKQDNVILRHYDFLVDRMSSEFGLVDKLYSNGTLSNLQRKQIEAKSLTEKRNKILLKHIIHGNSCQELFEALKECGQSHLVKYLEADGVYKPEFGGNWPLMENENTVLRKTYETLIDILESRDLVGRLHQTGLLSSKQVNLLDSKGTNEDQNRALLEFLRIGSLDFYRKMIRCLQESNQKHIAKLFESGGVYKPDFGGNWPLTNKERAMLSKNYETLIDLLDSSDLARQLYQTGALSRRQKNLISSKVTIEEQNKVLLEILRKGSLDVYWETIRCLHLSSQSHIARIVESGGVVVRIDANLQPRPSNLSEIENFLATEITNLLRQTPHAEASRIWEEVQLNLVGVAAKHSVSLYFLCSNEGDIDRLKQMASNGQLKKFVEDLFNRLMKFPTRIRVILKWPRHLFSRSRNCLKAIQVWNFFDEPMKTTIGYLHLELLDIILQKAYLWSRLQSGELNNDKDSGIKDCAIISFLASVDASWFRRIQRKRFKKSIWFHLESTVYN